MVSPPRIMPASSASTRNPLVPVPRMPDGGLPPSVYASLPAQMPSGAAVPTSPPPPSRRRSELNWVNPSPLYPPIADTKPIPVPASPPGSPSLGSSPYPQFADTKPIPVPDRASATFPAPSLPPSPPPSAPASRCAFPVVQRLPTALPPASQAPSAVRSAPAVPPPGDAQRLASQQVSQAQTRRSQSPIWQPCDADDRDIIIRTLALKFKPLPDFLNTPPAAPATRLSMAETYDVPSKDVLSAAITGCDRRWLLSEAARAYGADDPQFIQEIKRLFEDSVVGHASFLLFDDALAVKQELAHRHHGTPNPDRPACKAVFLGGIGMSSKRPEELLSQTIRWVRTWAPIARSGRDAIASPAAAPTAVAASAAPKPPPPPAPEAVPPGGARETKPVATTASSSAKPPRKPSQRTSRMATLT
jgi:hypothetical protein